MAKSHQRRNASLDTETARPVGVGTLVQHLEAMNGVMQDVLADKLDTRKANTVISASKQWGVHLNTGIRACRAGIPERIKSVASLPEAKI